VVVVQGDESECHNPKLPSPNPRLGNPLVHPYQAVSVGEGL
jgi:hypothetical protein